MIDPKAEELTVSEVPENELERTARDIKEIGDLSWELMRMGIGAKRVSSTDGTWSVDIVDRRGENRPAIFSRKGSKQELRDLSESVRRGSEYLEDEPYVINDGCVVQRGGIIEIADPGNAVFIVTDSGRESTYWLGKKNRTSRDPDLYSVEPVKEARFPRKAIIADRVNPAYLYYDQVKGETVMPEHFKVIGEQTDDTRNLRLDALSSVTPNIKAALQSIKASIEPSSVG